MHNDRITLTMKDILEKEFKIDARGYRMQEVDQFLDVIIRDYNEYNSMIKKLLEDNKRLSEENVSLKQEMRNLKGSIEAVNKQDSVVTNVDLIKRISKLEEIILGHGE